MSKVKIVGYTVPDEGGLFEPVGDPIELISDCARVSNPANQGNYDTAPRLLKYLIKNNHWSPFEMVNVVMEIEAPRDISRQILRHRSFSFNEFSQRYAEVAEFTERKARMQDTKNRQNSLPCKDEGTARLFLNMQQEVLRVAQRNYKMALGFGIAKEVARTLLPEGLTMSRLYMNGTLRSWIHYCDLRRGNGTQLEHQEIAEKCWKELLKIFPDIEGYYDGQSCT
jgi:thymidylate synthase (FAD)